MLTIHIVTIKYQSLILDVSSVFGEINGRSVSVLLLKFVNTYWILYDLQYTHIVLKKERFWEY